MKKLLLVIIIALQSIYGSAQVKASFKFYDTCAEEMVEIDYKIIQAKKEKLYEVDSLGFVHLPKPDQYVLIATKIEGKFYQSFEVGLKIDSGVMRVRDTIEIPRLIATYEAVTNSAYWNYHYCDAVANGDVMDFYASGKRRMAGRFDNGKPEMLSYYREDGSLDILEYFTTGEIEPYKVEYFNELGELQEYDLYTIKKKKFRIKTFDQNGELLYKSQALRPEY